MQIKNHWLENHAHQLAKLVGGEITPAIVILHDTASRLEKLNAANYLAGAGNVSVHFVIERDGTITQQVPCNRRAGHAGKSSFNGRSDCNAFAIGIEIVNPGKMTRLSGGSAVAWFGQEFGYGEYKLADVTTPEHGAGTWMPYTEEQIEAVEDLLKALFDAYSTLTDITTHWYVSPGRKIDVNPLFPLDLIRTRVLGHDDPADEAAEAGSSEHAQAVKVVSPGSPLNVRRWPSFNPNVIGTVSDGTVLPVFRRGIFDGAQWLCILFNWREGWIVENYTQPVT